MASDAPLEKVPWYLLIIFFLLSCGIGLAGYLYYIQEKGQLRRDQEKELKTITDLKASQLAAWRQERLVDAHFSQSDEHIASALSSYHDAQSWLSTLPSHSHYRSIAYYSPQGTPVLLSSDASARDTIAQHEAMAAAKSGAIEFSDMYLEPSSGEIRLIMFVPVFAAGRRSLPATGVLALGIDPTRFIYPLLENWPTPTHSAQTILVRVDSSDVVFLSNPHDQMPAVLRRLPVGNTQLPVSIAVSGREEIEEGVDFRGTPVMAAARRISGSTWYLVSSVDRDEVYIPLKERALFIGILAALLMITAGTAVVSHWRRLRLKYYQRHYESEIERQALERHYSSLTKYANDIILLMDDKGRIVDANDRALTSYGYGKSELLSMNIRDLQPEELRPGLAQATDAVPDKGGKLHETIHQRKDGSRFPVESNSRAIHVGTETYYQAVIRDTTERKEAAEALRSTNAFLRNILESSSAISIVSTDLEGNILFWNTGAEHILGYTTEEMVGKKNVACLYDQEDEGNKARVAAIRSRVREERVTVTTEVLERTKDGRAIWVKLSASPRFDDAGNVIGLLGIGEDITDKKVAEETSQQAERELRLLAFTVNCARDCFCVSDLEGQILFVNQSMLDTYGYAEEELMGKNLSILYRTDVPVAGEIFTRTKEGGWAGEVTNIRKDGSEFPIELWTSVVRNDAGGPVALLSVARDITTRRKTEDALNLQTAYFEQLFENSPQAIAIVDPEDRIVNVNPGFEALFQFRLEEVRGRKVNDVLVPGDLAPEGSQLSLSVLGGSVVQQETVRKRKDGNPVDVSVLGFPIQQSGKQIALYAIYTDISQRKRAEKVKTVLYKISQAANAAHNLSELYRLIHGILSEVMAAENFYIALHDRVRNCMQFPYFVDQFDQPPTPQTPRRGLTEYVLRTGRVLLAPPDVFDHLVHQGEIEPIGSPSMDWIGVPLKVEDRTIGVMVAQSYTETGCYTHQDGELLKFVSTQIAMAIERKQAEETLRENERSALAVLNATAETLILADEKGTILSINETGAKRLGSSVESLIGVNIYDTFEPELAHVRRSRALQVVATGMPIRFEDERNGVYFDTTIYPVGGADAAATRTVIFAQDITKRKVAEEKLHTLSRAIEQSPTSIVITDVRGNIEYVNPKFTHVTGYTVEEILGQNPRILKSGRTSDAEYKSMWETITSGKEWLGELQNRKKNGDLFWESASISPVTNGEGTITHFIAVKEDITERKNLEEQLRQAQKLESLGTLAGGIAHDVNNILAIILGHTTMIERKGSDPARLAQSLDAITRGVTRGTALVRQLLTFARKTEVQFRPVNVNDTVEELVKMLEETFPRTVAFSLQLDKSIPPITADGSQLHQSLLNLCVNARDAMRAEGTITVSTSQVNGADIIHRLPGVREDRYVCIEVCDTGSGMDEQTRSHIFEPFFTTKGVGKGTGLGLAVVYGVVNSHKGLVDVQTQLGSGTTFRLYFPLPPREPESPMVLPQATTEPAGGSETILVVEDEPMLLDVVKSLLESKGYTILTASDGVQAVDMYRRHHDKIALVLTDLGLPKLGGWEAIEIIREINPQVRVVVATGYLDPGAKAKMLSGGAGEFIQKPYVPMEVARKVRDVLDAAGDK